MTVPSAKGAARTSGRVGNCFAPSILHPLRVLREFLKSRTGPGATLQVSRNSTAARAEAPLCGEFLKSRTGPGAALQLFRNSITARAEAPLCGEFLKRLLAVALACATLLAQEHSGENASPTQRSTIRANVHLVLVPVTVTDQKGKFIDGLSASDFVLYDDGVPQRELQVDSSDTLLAPVALVIAIQCSGISQAALEKIHKVGGMFQPLVAGEKGEAAVIAYDDEIRVLQDFTRDSTKLTRAFEEINGRTIKSGKMFDAVNEGAKMLQKTPDSYRRMLLILGESRDRGSKTKLDAAIEAVQRANVTVYPCDLFRAIHRLDRHRGRHRAAPHRSRLRRRCRRAHAYDDAQRRR